MKKKQWLRLKESLIDVLVRIICKIDNLDSDYKTTDLRIHNAYDALMPIKKIVSRPGKSSKHTQ